MDDKVKYRKTVKPYEQIVNKGLLKDRKPRGTTIRIKKPTRNITKNDIRKSIIDRIPKIIVMTTPYTKNKVEKIFLFLS